MHVLTGAYTTAAVLVSLSLTLLGHKRKSSRRRPNKTGQQCTQHDQTGRFYAACSTGQFDGGNEGRAELWLTKRSQGESSHSQHGLRQLIQLQPIGHLSQVLYAVAQRDHHFDLVVCQRDSGAVTAVSTLFLAHTFPSSTGATSLVAFRSIGADGRLLICCPQAPLRMQLGAFKPCPRSLWQRTALGLRNVRWPDQVLGFTVCPAAPHGSFHSRTSPSSSSNTTTTASRRPSQLQSEVAGLQQQVAVWAAACETAQAGMQAAAAQLAQAEQEQAQLCTQRQQAQEALVTAECTHGGIALAFSVHGCAQAHAAELYFVTHALQQAQAERSSFAGGLAAAHVVQHQQARELERLLALQCTLEEERCQMQLHMGEQRMELAARDACIEGLRREVDKLNTVLQVLQQHMEFCSSLQLTPPSAASTPHHVQRTPQAPQLSHSGQSVLHDLDCVVSILAAQSPVGGERPAFFGKMHHHQETLATPSPSAGNDATTTSKTAYAESPAPVWVLALESDNAEMSMAALKLSLSSSMHPTCRWLQQRQQQQELRRAGKSTQGGEIVGVEPGGDSASSGTGPRADTPEALGKKWQEMQWDGMPTASSAAAALVESSAAAAMLTYPHALTEAATGTHASTSLACLKQQSTECPDTNTAHFHTPQPSPLRAGACGMAVSMACADTGPRAGTATCAATCPGTATCASTRSPSLEELRMRMARMLPRALLQSPAALARAPSPQQLPLLGTFEGASAATVLESVSSYAAVGNREVLHAQQPSVSPTGRAAAISAGSPITPLACNNAGTNQPVAMSASRASARLSQVMRKVALFNAAAADAAVAAGDSTPANGGSSKSTGGGGGGGGGSGSGSGSGTMSFVGSQQGSMRSGPHTRASASSPSSSSDVYASTDYAASAVIQCSIQREPDKQQGGMRAEAVTHAGRHGVEGEGGAAVTSQLHPRQRAWGAAAATAHIPAAENAGNVALPQCLYGSSSASVHTRSSNAAAHLQPSTTAAPPPPSAAAAAAAAPASLVVKHAGNAGQMHQGTSIYGMRRAMAHGLHVEVPVMGMGLNAHSQVGGGGAPLSLCNLGSAWTPYGVGASQDLWGSELEERAVRACKQQR